MSRDETKYEKSLSETVEELVKSAGGWLNVIGRMTSTFDSALGRAGKLVDCPFANRHKKGGGRGKFRFTDDLNFEGRAICTCMQARGMSPVELLIEDGVATNWTKCMVKIFNALNPDSCHRHVRREVAPVVRTFYRELTQEQIVVRKEKLTLIARDLVDFNHPTAEPLRLYFALRGIPVNGNLKDVKFHPGLKYWADADVQDGEKEKKVLVGIFPAIVSAFRSKDGRVVNFHRIFINRDGTKAKVEEVKKICSSMPGFSGSSITIAKTEGRTLNVTEGVEKGWAVHLATGESVKAAYSCSSLPKLYVDKAEYDHVVIWSDCDPANPNRNRQSGDGQYFAWELARRLFTEGFDVTFMMPAGNPIDVKGRDWEDVIVQEGVLDLEGSYYRFQTLKQYAAKGGVERLHNRAA